MKTAKPMTKLISLSSLAVSVLKKWNGISFCVGLDQRRKTAFFFGKKLRIFLEKKLKIFLEKKIFISFGGQHRQ